MIHLFGLIAKHVYWLVYLTTYYNYKHDNNYYDDIILWCASS